MELLRICGRDVPVVPQKHARLRHRLGQADFQAVLSADYSHESYRVLGILIPALLPENNPAGIPEWEWDGYPTREAWDASKEGTDTYDEDHDPSPTTAEIINAFETALMVSGANRLGKILGLVQSGATLVGVQQTDNSPASPGENGESPSTSTGMKVPT